MLLKRLYMTVKKINAIDTSRLVNKTDYNAKIKDIEHKLPTIPVKIFQTNSTFV